MNVEELWYGRTVGARSARAAASPLSWLYMTVVSARNALYDRRVLRIHDSPIPVVSVGNVTVGGTGKTPFSAYVVGALLEAGHRPAVVMRGYGDDELHLHARMNPGIPVIADVDRVAGIKSATAAGADVAVLDDGFQHRRAHRDLDIVLVSAEHWHDNMRLLPAGPLREPVRSLARADLIVITQKSASDTEVVIVVRSIQAMPAISAAVIVAALVPNKIMSASGEGNVSLDAMRGESVLAVAGIGDPGSFFTQLRQLGARVTERRFGDHHAYTETEVGQLASESASHKYAITTEKDTVKLSKLWPANGSELWYLSQAVRLTEGRSLFAAALVKLFKRATSIVG